MILYIKSLWLHIMLHLTCWHLLLDSSHQFILIVDILNKKDEAIGYGKVSWELKELSHGGPTYFLVNLPPLSYSMNFMPIKYGRKKNNINSLFIFVTLSLFILGNRRHRNVEYIFIENKNKFDIFKNLIEYFFLI